MLEEGIKRYANVVDLLRVIGVEFEMDYDGEIQITLPDDAYNPKVTANLQKCVNYWREQIESQYRSRCRDAITCYVGGPLHNRRLYGYHLEGDIVRSRIECAKWAVYEVRSNGDRAHFLGYAKSEAKAMRKDLYETARQQD